MASRVKPVIEYDGISFYLDVNGYYASPKQGKLNRYIWKKFFGDIPEKHIIHHKDGNKINNAIENLELMEWGEHSRHHLNNILA